MLHCTPFSFPVIADIHKPPAVFTAVCSWNHHLFIIPTANVFFKEAITVIPVFRSQLDTGLWGSYYSFYIITGYLISKHQMLDRFKSQSLLFGIILAFVLNSTGQYYLYSHHYYQSAFLYWYSDFAIFLIGIFTFELLRRRYHNKAIIKFAPVIEYISRCSFGIYIIHKPILVVLQKYFNHLRPHLYISRCQHYFCQSVRQPDSALSI